MQQFATFEYVYRDSANYKSWGAVLLAGSVDSADIQRIMGSLDSGTWFVAEQVGLPALYDIRIADTDHAFHEFVDLRPATGGEIEDLEVFGDLGSLVAKFQERRGSWKCGLSPHS